MGWNRTDEYCLRMKSIYSGQINNVGCIVNWLIDVHGWLQGYLSITTPNTTYGICESVKFKFVYNNRFFLIHFFTAVWLALSIEWMYGSHAYDDGYTANQSSQSRPHCYTDILQHSCFYLLKLSSFPCKMVTNTIIFQAFAGHKCSRNVTPSLWV